MINLDHSRYHIISLHLITKVNSIVMIKESKTFLSKISTIRKKWIVKVSFVVKYQPPCETCFSHSRWYWTEKKSPDSSGGSLITETRKSNIQRSHTKPQLKEKNLFFILIHFIQYSFNRSRSYNSKRKKKKTIGIIKEQQKTDNTGERRRII